MRVASHTNGSSWPSTCRLNRENRALATIRPRLGVAEQDDVLRSGERTLDRLGLAPNLQGSSCFFSSLSDESFQLGFRFSPPPRPPGQIASRFIKHRMLGPRRNERRVFAPQHLSTGTSSQSQLVYCLFFELIGPSGPCPMVKWPPDSRERSGRRRHRDGEGDSRVCSLVMFATLALLGNPV